MVGRGTLLSLWFSLSLCLGGRRQIGPKHANLCLVCCSGWSRGTEGAEVDAAGRDASGYEDRADCERAVEGA
jgi:hypothetical protein